MEIMLLVLLGLASSSLSQSLSPNLDFSNLADSQTHIPSLPITNQANSYFLAKVTIGSNQKTFNLIVDTGSTATWIVDSKCPGCTLMTTNTYTPSLSKNSTALGLGNKVSYEDGSYVQGQMYVDLVSIAGLTTLATFLDVNSTSFHWAGFKADGVLGLGFEQSTKGYPPIIKALRAANLIPSAQFSLFYTDQTFKGRRKATMTIGAADYSSYANPKYLQYLGVANSVNLGNSLWNIYASNILMNDSVVSKQQMVVLDSAQPWIFVGAEDYLNVESVLLSLGFSYSAFTYSRVCKTSSGFPSIFIEVNSTFYLEIPSYRYLKLYDDGKTRTCHAAISKSSNNNWYVGDALFKSYYTVFNYENSTVVFTPAAWEANVKHKKKHHDDDDDGLPGWAIALIVIGCLAVVAAVAALIWVYLRRKDRNRNYDSTGKSLQEVSLHA